MRGEVIGSGWGAFALQTETPCGGTWHPRYRCGVQAATAAGCGMLIDAIHPALLSWRVSDARWGGRAARAGMAEGPLARLLRPGHGNRHRCRCGAIARTSGGCVAAVCDYSDGLSGAMGHPAGTHRHLSSRRCGELVSHERGSTFLTIVARNGVLGSQFATFDILEGLLPLLFSFTQVLWALLVYGFLGAVTATPPSRISRMALNGSWLLLVVATETLAVLGSFPALRSGEAPALVFASLAFLLFGAMLYISAVSAGLFFRWMFRPMRPAEMSAPWWINMGAVAIATLAGAPSRWRSRAPIPTFCCYSTLSTPSRCSFGPPAHSGYRCW